MSIETVVTCPLGSTCEEIKNEKLHRCKWYMEMDGEDASGKVHDKVRKCVMEWQIIMMMEQGRAGLMHTQAIQMQTSEVSKRQDAALQVMTMDLKSKHMRNELNAKAINN